MRDGEIVAQMEIQRMQNRLKRGGGDHRDTETVHLFADRIVLLAELEQLVHFDLELLVLVAQAQHLALRDRDGPSAVRVRDHHVRHQFRMLFKELRMILQVLRNFL